MVVISSTGCPLAGLECDRRPCDTDAVANAVSLPAGATTATSMSRLLDQAVVERIADQLCARRAARLLLNVGAMRLDRPHAEVQLRADFRVGMAESDQAEDLELTLGQPVGRPFRLKRSRGELSTQFGIEVRLTGGGRAHRVDELVAGGVLQHVAERTGAHRLAGERGVLLHRQYDDRRLGRLLAELGERRQ